MRPGNGFVLLHLVCMHTECENGVGILAPALVRPVSELVRLASGHSGTWRLSVSGMGGVNDLWTLFVHSPDVDTSTFLDIFKHNHHQFGTLCNRQSFGLRICART